MSQHYTDRQPTETPVSTGDWLLTTFLAGIPIVGLIMLVVWAFGGGAPQSKANWARAMLIWAVLAMLLAGAVMFFVVFLGLLTTAVQQ
ncbi:MAG: hypothetical protein HYV27_00505 [Candidatus Hydrogenedentes bacterium]|nr:hypothetical protein [Candidatus Hydrogenedentota bacterium]